MLRHNIMKSCTISVVQTTCYKIQLDRMSTKEINQI